MVQGTVYTDSDFFVLFYFLRVVWGFLSQCSFHLKDRIVSVFNTVQPKSTKITGTQY